MQFRCNEEFPVLYLQNVCKQQCLLHNNGQKKTSDQLCSKVLPFYCFYKYFLIKLCKYSKYETKNSVPCIRHAYLSIGRSHMKKTVLYIVMDPARIQISKAEFGFHVRAIRFTINSHFTKTGSNRGLTFSINNTLIIKCVNFYSQGRFTPTKTRTRL